MKRVWHTSSKVLAGLVLVAMYAMPQGYTVSAKPGAVNYIDGHASLNGNEISQNTLGKTFLSTNDTLSTDLGKAEVLLTPGVFLRIGQNSQIRMVSASLTNTQVEVIKGEAMLEVADLLKDNNIEILARGGSLRVGKPGLYRVTADDPPVAAVMEGKAELSYGGRTVDLGKGKEAVIAADLKREKFDSKKEDDLYAWSNVRSEYNAGASYAAARSVTTNSYNGYNNGYNGYNNVYGGWAGYPGAGMGYGYGPGWYYSGAWNSWAWMPGDGYFFSPFGWGFYSPAYIAYAPVVYVPVGGRTAPTAVPINTRRPPAVTVPGSVPRSPAALSAARSQSARTLTVVQPAARMPQANGTVNQSNGRVSQPSARSAQSGHATQPSVRMSAPAPSMRGGGMSAPSAPSGASRSTGSRR
ncbi:MAG: FecR domain-containing protein [Bryobacteraceae bacterium]